MLGKTAMLEFKDMEGNTVLTGKDLKDSKASADQSGRPVVTLQSMRKEPRSLPN